MCAWRDRLVRVVKCSVREVVTQSLKGRETRRDETNKDDSTRLIKLRS
jgi:hypothetical protein